MNCSVVNVHIDSAIFYAETDIEESTLFQSCNQMYRCRIFKESYGLKEIYGQNHEISLRQWNSLHVKWSYDLHFVALHTFNFRKKLRSMEPF